MGVEENVRIKKVKGVPQYTAVFVLQLCAQWSPRRRRPWGKTRALLAAMSEQHGSLGFQHLC